MSEIQMRAIRILNSRGPMRGSDLGWELWGTTTRSPQRGTGSHGHNKFCLAAGKLLRQLESLRLVEPVAQNNCTVWRTMTRAKSLTTTEQITAPDR